MLLVFDTPEETDKFVRLYEDYKRTAFYSVKRFINDDFIVEDLIQEIFIIIAKHLDRIDPEDRIKSRNYIITIARNYSKDYLRKQNRLKEDLQEDDPVLPVHQLTNSGKDILNNMIVQDIYDRLTAQIAKMADKYKIVMELKYINEFTDDEIADFLGITKQNVQVRLYRAKAMLRSKMGNEDYSFE